MSWTSEQWKQAVRTLGYCVRCGAVCQPDVCHRNEGKGMGMKVPDCATWAGCRECHVIIDQGKDMTREQRRAESDCMIVRTIIALVPTGFFDDFADASPKKHFSPLRQRSRQHGARNPTKRVARKEESA